MAVDKRKFLTILKNLYSGDAVLVGMATKATQQMEEAEHEAFTQFQVDVGALFIELKDELDKGLEDMADSFPEETDPRKWDVIEWSVFHKAAFGHKFYEIYSTMAQGKPNIDLIWGELENRIDFS